jgi:predicted phosphodiesterase
MKTIKSRSIGDAARRIATARNLEPEAVRQAILDGIRIGNHGKDFGFLSYPGILPVNLPDGARIVVLPDIHVPAHNKKIMWALLRFLREYRPHIIIFIGDVADVFALSRWPAPPRVSKNVQQELDETRRLVDEIIEVSGCAHAFYIMGNHEDRVYRYLTDPASHLAGVLDAATREPILSFHGLMGYKPEDPVTFVYDLAEKGGYGGGLLVNNDMLFHHGYIVRPNPGASPRADADKTGLSTTHGHTHRAGMSARETDEGIIRAIELGHLTDPTHPYMGYANLLNNWHPAFGAGLVHGGKVHLQVVPIKQVTIDGQRKFVFTFAGKVYTQADR